MVIAVPATAGIGSEVGRAALVTVSGVPKLGFSGPKMLPVAAICDPDATVTMSPGLTAACGIAAISYCVEALFSTRVNPVAEAIARDGLRRGIRYLATVVARYRISPLLKE